MKRKIDQEALKYVVEKIKSSGYVVSGQVLARLAGVNQATISRNLRAIGIPFEKGRTKYEANHDKEPRSYEEIVRLVKIELENEGLNSEQVISSKELVKRLGLSCSARAVRRAMQKYDVPNSWERLKQRKRC